MSLDIANMDIVASVINDSCAVCGLGPPPDLILHIPPPPLPAYLQHSSNGYSNAGVLINPTHLNNSLCKHSCNWRTEGVQYIEMPQQGTVFDDTWLLVLISSCVGIIFIGLILAALVLRCKFNNGIKSSAISIPAATPCTDSKTVRMQNEAVIYPCSADNIQDSRVMWATLTPRGTTRHYIEEHTYETIGNGPAAHKQCISYSSAPLEHTYVQPSISSPVQSRPKDDKAFDNTAFVDYEEPLPFNPEYYQPGDNSELAETGLYAMQKSTLRPHVSSPTRIEHPNLPPLNLYPTKYGTRRGSGNHQHPMDILPKANNIHTLPKVLPFQ